MRHTMKKLVLGVAFVTMYTGLTGCAGGGCAKGAAGAAATGTGSSVEGKILNPAENLTNTATSGSPLDNIPLFGPKIEEPKSNPIGDFIRSKVEGAVNQNAIDTTGANGPAGQAAGLVNGATSIARVGSQFAPKPADQVNGQVVDYVNKSQPIQDLTNAVKQEQGR